MPILKQSSSSSAATQSEPAQQPDEVFYVPETGEIFDDYEKYVDGLFQRGKPVWSCKYTGKSNLTFQEALESERKAQELLDSFPECWKAPVLRLIQHTFETPEAVASYIVDFAKIHYVQGEYVRIDINSEVRYWGEVLVATHVTRPDESDASEYKVNLAAEPHGTIIGEASFVGTPPFTRLKNPPGKTLIKKFIKNCASKNLFPGSPWIVNAELASKYGIACELPPHLAEVALKAAKLMNRSDSGSKENIVEDGNFVDPNEPVPDEDLMQSVDINPAPIPFPQGTLMDKIIDIWMFCQSFSTPLRLTPFSLKDLLAALRHDELPNPLLESVHNCLLTPLCKERRTGGSQSLSTITSKSAYSILTEVDVEDIMDDIEDSVALEHLEKIKWWEAPSSATHAWWINFGAFLRDFAFSNDLPIGHPIRKLILSFEPAFTRSQSKAYLSFNLDQRVECLYLLVKLLEVLPFVRQHVDDQLERSIEARKSRRQCEIDRNKLVKEQGDLVKEINELSGNNENIEEGQLKEVKKLEAAVRKLVSQQESLAKRSESYLKEARKCSAFRTATLGLDRSKLRYWWLDNHLVTTPSEVGSNLVLLEDPMTRSWSYYDDIEHVKLMMSSLNLKGIREAQLHAKVSQIIDLIHLRTFTDKVSVSVAEEFPEPVEEGSSSSEEEMIVVPRRRGRGRPPMKRSKTDSSSIADLPSFLRYKNILFGKK